MAQSGSPRAARIQSGVGGGLQFNFVHLSDLHVGLGPDRYLWPNCKESFLQDLQVVLPKLGSVDAILFTGDLTQKGSNKEFAKFDVELEEILTGVRSVLPGSNPVFLAVPGNHDLERPQDQAVLGGAKLWMENAALQQEFFRKKGSFYKGIQKAFKPWSEFWGRRGQGIADPRLGVIPGDFAGRLDTPSGARVGFLCLNSAFLQLEAGEKLGKLSIDVRQMADLCPEGAGKWADQHDFCLLLTHHGKEWLDQRGQDALVHEIAPQGRFHLHLFGHEHRGDFSALSSGAGRTRSLGLGSSLFGMEYTAVGVERRHGYAVGRISVGEDRRCRLQLWPRMAKKAARGGWKFVADTDSYDLEEGSFLEMDLGPARRPMAVPPPPNQKGAPLPEFPIEMAGPPPSGGPQLSDDLRRRIAEKLQETYPQPRIIKGFFVDLQAADRAKEDWATSLATLDTREVQKLLELVRREERGESWSEFLEELELGPLATILRGAAEKRWLERLRDGQTEADLENWAAALEKANGVLQELEGAGEQPKLRKLLVQARFARARWGLPVDSARARRDLDWVEEKVVSDPSLLSDQRDRARLARCWIRVGERERGLRHLEGLEGDDVRVTLQHVELLEGRIPTDLAVVPWLQLQAAGVELDHGHAGAAFDRIAAIPWEKPLSPSNHLHALFVLTHAVVQTLQGESGQEIPLERRAELVRLLDDRIRRLARATLLPTQQSLFAETVALCEQADLHPYWRFVAGLPVHGITELQGRADRDEAEPPDLPAWAKRFTAFGALELEERLQKLEELHHEYPRNAQIFTRLAGELVQGRHFAEAIPYARRAFKEFPGHGQRFLLAQCLHALGAEHAAEVWELLEALPNDLPEEWRRVALLRRAWSATHLDPKRGVELWREFLNRYGADTERSTEVVQARLSLSDALFTSGDFPGAAEQAGLAVALARTWQDLNAIGQRLKLALDLPGRREDLKKVVDRLEREFGDVPEAELARYLLRQELGAHGGAVDFGKLVQAGLMQPVSVEDLVALATERLGQTEVLAQGWRLGWISTEFFCKGQGGGLFSFLHERVDQSLWLGGWASTRTPPIPSLTGRKILLGGLELILLHLLELLQPLLDLLGPKGKLVLFRDDHDGLISEIGTLYQLVQHRDLARQADLLRRLSVPPFRLAESPVGSETEELVLAQTRGWRLIHHEDPGNEHRWHSPAALHRWLRQRQEISGDPPDLYDGGEELAAEGLPEEVLITWVALQELHTAGLLDTLYRSSPRTRWWVGDHSYLMQADRVRALRRPLDAAEAGRDLLRRLEHDRSRIQLLPRPEHISWLPSPARPEDAGLGTMLKNCAGYRQVIADQSELLLLSTEVLTSMLPAIPPGLMRRMQPKADVAAWLNVLVGQQDRILHLPDIARLTNLRSINFKLAKMGLPDALDADDLLLLATQFSVWNDGEPARILQSWSAVAADEAHLGSLTAQHYQALHLGLALWLGWVRGEATTQTLLFHLEAMEQQFPRLGMLEVALGYCLMSYAGDPRQGFVPAGGGQMVLSPESPAGRLLDHLSRWAVQVPARWLALERAWLALLRELLPKLDQAGKAQLSVFGLAWWMTPAGPAVGGRHWVDTPLRAALLSLSSNFPHSSLPISHRERPLDPLLRSLAAKVARDPSQLLWEEDAVLLEVEEEKLLVPPESLFVRLPLATQRQLGPLFVEWIGPLDGRLVDRIQALRQVPPPSTMHFDLITAAVEAPWRVLSQDPTRLVFLGSVLHRALYYPATLSELRELLSEPGEFPEQPDPASPGREVMAAVLGRISGGWRDRPDLPRLLWQCANTPGLLTGLPALHEANPQEVADSALSALAAFGGGEESALESQDRADSLPATALATALFRLRRAAAVQPMVDYRGSSVDLRDVLPGYVLRLLQRLQEPPAQGSIASLELPLLRTCAKVVGRVGAKAGASYREGLWLVWRLYGWFLDLVQRRGGLTAEEVKGMVQLAPPQTPEAVVGQDLFDPFRLDGDYRLVVVLQALEAGLSADVQRYLPYSEALQQLLIKIAKQPWSPEIDKVRRHPSVFGTGIPPTPQDLAGSILLKFDLNLYRKLPEYLRVAMLDGLALAETLSPAQIPHLMGLCVSLPLPTDGENSLAKQVLLRFAEQDPLVGMAVGGLASLCAAGEDSLAEPIWARAMAALGGDQAGVVLMWLLVMEAKRGEAHFRAAFERLRREVRPEQQILVAQGLRAVIFERGDMPRAAAAEMIRELAALPGMEADPRMQQLRRVIGDRS